MKRLREGYFAQPVPSERRGGLLSYTEINKDSYRIRHDSFSAMFKAATDGNGRFSLENVIRDWWQEAFGFNKSFPSEGISAMQASLQIQYHLKYMDARKYGAVLGDRFYCNYRDVMAGKVNSLTPSLKRYLSCMSDSVLSKTIIYPLHTVEEKEESMARVLRQAVAAEPVRQAPERAPRLPSTKMGKATAPAAVTAGKPRSAPKAPAAPRITMREECCKLIAGQALPDTKIVDTLKKVLGKDTPNLTLVADVRRRLNNGDWASTGYPIQKRPYCRILEKGEKAPV